MEIQHFSHAHTLLFNEEQCHESEEKAHCLGCGELVSGPSFSCVECKFYLDKKCAEAPAELNHPFHPKHSFHLLAKPEYQSSSCNFCNKICENFVYHCSCLLDLHVKCAMFSYDIAEKRLGDQLQHMARIDPSISIENRNNEELKKAECFACWKPLLDFAYFSPDCGFYLHEKCADLVTKINHPLHHEHPLFLQFNSENLSCTMCKKTQLTGFVYCCPPCEFVLDIQCAASPTKLNQSYYHRKHPLTLQFVPEHLPCRICQETQPRKPVFFCSICKYLIHVGCVSPAPPLTEDKIHHEHHFSQLIRREVSLVCDACGVSGNFVPYVCSICSHMIHKKCISLPRIIQFVHHYHPLLHTYFLESCRFETLECRACYEEVKTEHGSYFCSKCNYILHVNCALENPLYYNVVDSNQVGEDTDLPYSVDEFIDSSGNVTGTSIKHFSHAHNLALSEDIKENRQCDGCLLSISASYYYCSQCDFFLHKSCAELPIKKHIWYHYHSEGGPLPKLNRLISDGIFLCGRCEYESSGFGYYCDMCWGRYCVPCASTSDIPRCLGHEHPLPFHLHYKGLCNGCGRSLTKAYRCKRCNFALDVECLVLPVTARHKSDEHPLKLTYRDSSNYSECYYCDICEKERNPNLWFYSCEICNNAAHPKCVVRKDAFIKLGSTYTKGDHPHPLTFVRKVYFYPECKRCGKRCLDLDLALECEEIGCNYIVHWECVKPSNPLQRKYNN